MPVMARSIFTNNKVLIVNVGKPTYITKIPKTLGAETMVDEKPQPMTQSSQRNHKLAAKEWVRILWGCVAGGCFVLLLAAIMFDGSDPNWPYPDLQAGHTIGILCKLLMVVICVLIIICGIIGFVSNFKNRNTSINIIDRIIKMGFGFGALAVVSFMLMVNVYRWEAGERYSNLSSLGNALLSYAGDNEGKYPKAEKWCDLLEPYIKKRERVFVYSFWGKKLCYYAMNPDIDSNSSPNTIVFFESRAGWNLSGGPFLIDKSRFINKDWSCVVFNERVHFDNDTLVVEDSIYPWVVESAVWRPSQKRPINIPKSQANLDETKK